MITHNKNYKEHRNKYTHNLDKSKTKHISNEILEIGNDSKKLFATINKLTGNIKENLMPSNFTNQELANQFANFYIEKIEKIRDSLSNFDRYKSTGNCPVKLDKFEILEPGDVKKLMSKTNSKTCESDPIPSRIIKENTEILLPIFTRIIKASLQTGNFINDWKTSIVKPLLKKPGLDLVKKSL